MLYLRFVNRLLGFIRAINGRQAFAVCALLYLALAPSHGFGESWCLFHALFSVDCPACGLTRSMSCALHGEIAASWSYHPLGVLALLLLGFAGCAPSLFEKALSVAGGSKNRRRMFAAGIVTLVAGVWVYKTLG